MEPILTAAVLFGVAAVMGTLACGIRRIPWRYAILFGIGFGVVIGAVSLAKTDVVEPAILVLIGAIGGSAAQLAFERGERERRRISAAITGVGEGRPA
jgi:hypothetical protein